MDSTLFRAPLMVAPRFFTGLAVRPPLYSLEMMLYTPVLVVNAPLLKLLAPMVVAYTFRALVRVEALSTVVSPSSPL